MPRAAAFFDLDRTLIAGSSGLPWARAATKAGLISRRPDGELGRGRASLPASWRDRRGDREAAGGGQGGLSRHLGAPDRAPRARRCWSGCCRGSTRRCSRRSTPTRTRAGRPSSSARPATSSSSCWRGSSTWTAVSAPLTRSARTVCSPASSAARSCTARARSRRCGASPTTHGIDLGVSYAYSDSASDLPMLRAVGNPVVVNPDEELTRIARERGLARDAVREARPAPGDRGVRGRARSPRVCWGAIGSAAWTARSSRSRVLRARRS